MSSVRGKRCLVSPSKHGQVSDCVDHNIHTIAAGPSQHLIMDILNDVMGFGFECIPSKGLHGLNLELKQRRKVSCLLTPSEQGQVSDCVDHNIHTTAAGPSQCLIMDILNDVRGFGLECIASKGLHGLNFVLFERKKLSCVPK